MSILKSSSFAATALLVVETFSVCNPVANAATIPQCTNLPPEAYDTEQEIENGGPYAFPNNDNTTFGNYEGILPQEPAGYYREYTVITPDATNRGTRRIITGGGTETDPDVWYYTADHYQSFCQIPESWT